MSILMQKTWKGKGFQIMWADDGSWYITDKKDTVNHLLLGFVYAKESHNGYALCLTVWKLAVRFGWIKEDNK